jgi:hypothetical protein
MLSSSLVLPALFMQKIKDKSKKIKLTFIDITRNMPVSGLFIKKIKYS